MSIKINFKFKPGDSISGDSIIGRAGTIYTKGLKRKGRLQLKKLQFFKSAECIKRLPITMLKKPSIKNVILEGLRGKKIYGESENYIGSGRHTLICDYNIEYS